MKRIKVVGVGNLIMQDDGAGVHVIQRLAEMNFPSNVEFIDAGVNSYDMVDIFCDSDILVVVDAMNAGGDPGTIYRAPLEELGLKAVNSLTSVHELHFADAVRMVNLLGQYPQVIVYGIEPAETGLGMDLTPVVAEKVPRLVELIAQEVNSLLQH